MAQTEAPISSQSHLYGLHEYLKMPPRAQDVELDIGILAHAATSSSEAQLSVQGRTSLLPDDYVWPAVGAENPRIPLPLCEFLAYKAALAYKIDDATQTHELNGFCEGIDIDDLHFFDTSDDKITDTQAYGFRFENTAFIIFRGSLEDTDWKLNYYDQPTDVLADRSWARKNKDRTLKALERKYGDLLQFVGDTGLTRHLGMSIGWAAVRNQILAWLRSLPAQNGPCPVILSGHSLGGALAHLAAFELATEQRRHIAAVITFGAPPVGAANFASEYDRLLGERTVRLESQGDLIPDVMGRWYYNPLFYIRHWAKGSTGSRTAPSYKHVGHAWNFAEAPPPSIARLKNWIAMVRKSAERREKERQSRAHRSSDQTRNRSRRRARAGSIAFSAHNPQNIDATDSAERPLNRNNRGPPNIFWLVATVIIAIFLWAFAREKTASHAVETRYALYLSTLSYQQLRSLLDGNLTLANAALDRYLNLVRGDLPFFNEIAALPLRVEQKHFKILEQALEMNRELDEYASSDSKPLIDLGGPARSIF